MDINLLAVFLFFLGLVFAFQSDKFAKPLRLSELGRFLVRIAGMILVVSGISLASVFSVYLGAWSIGFGGSIVSLWLGGSALQSAKDEWFSLSSNRKAKRLNELYEKNKNIKIEYFRSLDSVEQADLLEKAKDWERMNPYRFAFHINYPDEEIVATYLMGQEESSAKW